MAMRVVVTDHADEADRALADELAAALASAPAPAIGVATGATPRGGYRELVRRHRAGGLVAGSPSLWLVDEYVGLAPDDPRTYRAEVHRELADPLGIARVHGPDAWATDAVAACDRFEAEVVAAGVDLQVLGIGRNGHIGFNEPGTRFDSTTRRVRLSPTTRADNARHFQRPDDVPHLGITQGIGTLLRARRVVLVATGTAKADALAAAVDGPVSERCPASALRRHPDVLVLCDRAAAARLSPR
ncbi:MAG TPA: glucosamine-6-phosphate deaminase [Acidimicrobiales bacterium]|nr:glucosamine-6-phosphate deaminase [Acidimicrobiales bacterium]